MIQNNLESKIKIEISWIRLESFTGTIISVDFHDLLKIKPEISCVEQNTTR